MAFQSNVALAPLTTFELGGPARFFTEAASEADLIAALEWGKANGTQVFVLGGGSNLVVGDSGWDGLVVRIATSGTHFFSDGRVQVEAGVRWDAFVAEAVTRGLGGIECLSGIPGSVGATPVQNVGAYGQDVSETIASVRVLDRATLEISDWTPERCGFAYRDSAFKRAPNQHVVLTVTFALRPNVPPAIRYAELREALAANAAPTLAATRDTVLALRRKKSMVIDPHDPNRRSAGSFFTNPIVSDAEAKRVIEKALADGLATTASEIPAFPAGAGRTKLAAGWLIERAGIAKGFRQGAVGVSSHHALALVHHGGGTTAALLDLARHVRDRVQASFAVTLIPEPVFLGVDW